MNLAKALIRIAEINCIKPKDTIEWWAEEWWVETITSLLKNDSTASYTDKDIRICCTVVARFFRDQSLQKRFRRVYEEILIFLISDMVGFQVNPRLPKIK